jgi:hypothetical protein
LHAKDDEAPVDPEELRRQQVREERRERKRRQQELHQEYDHNTDEHDELAVSPFFMGYDFARTAAPFSASL